MILVVAACASTAWAQSFSCVADAAVPPLVRPEGIAELAGDIVLECSGFAPVNGIVSNITVFSNTAITSRLLGGTSEALLLIGEPAPTTQVLGVNVFQGTVVANSVVFPGVPLVNAPGGAVTRVLRITNMRLNASGLAGPGTSLLALTTIGGAVSVPVSNPVHIVGFVGSPMAFSAAARCTSAGQRTVDLRFAESFPTEFKLRGGVGQSTPGNTYNTETGFTPDPVITDVGTADGGTRLSSVFSGIADGTQLSVPATVTNGTLTITAVSPAGGGLVPIVGGTTTILYEVTAAHPLATEGISVPVAVSGTFSEVTIKGSLAPTSTVLIASSTDPLPRFADDATAMAVPDACIAPVPSMSPYTLAGLILILLGLGAAGTRRFSRR